MVFPAHAVQTAPVSAHSIRENVMELLSKIAAVLVTLLLYGVITILQMPRTARAAEAWAPAALGQAVQRAD
jgi:hypothetical protein